MRVLDLFAGIGGFSLAAHWMGWETAAFVEKEKFCQKVLRKNFGNGIEIHDDIFEFSGKPFRGRVDIVTGGFPCQPFSAAGKRKGRNDERHLFPEMLRVIREVQPRWVVAENVRGLLSIEFGSVFAEVVASLESEGFEVVTFCVPASAVEAPHRRDRLWIVANSSGVSAFTNGSGLQGRRHSTDKQAIFSGNGIEFFHCDVDNAELPRLEGLGKHVEGAERWSVENRPDAQADWSLPWPQAAARFCRVDDGISDRVHRLKALGNSIVPQIAFEIFKAIEQAEIEFQNK